MSRATFRSNSGNFFRKNDDFKDMVHGKMSQDIEVNLKTTAGMPVDKGQMKAATRHFKTSFGWINNWRVEIDKEYASYQERGMRKDGTRIVKNYTTGGTSAGFFQRAIDAVVRNRSSYMQEARRALGL